MKLSLQNLIAFSRMPAIIFCAFASAACSTEPVSVNEVMNHTRCHGLTVGISKIEEHQLAGIRGSRLLTEPGTEASAPTRPESAAKPTQSLLVAVFNGDKPTSGYHLEFVEAGSSGSAVLLNYKWLEPAPGSMQSQAFTSPCSIVQITHQGGVRSIVARFNDETWNELQLEPVEKALAQ